jgi:hypothetical protein
MGPSQGSGSGFWFHHSQVIDETRQSLTKQGLKRQFVRSSKVLSRPRSRCRR